jgi:hypothetical protein
MYVVLPRQHVSAASPGDVVINELMYNPSTGNQNDEFIEIYNTTASPISLDGWCFTEGISVCFDSSYTLGAHDYLVLSPDSAQFAITYGIEADGNYTGALSNGGETITLQDNTATTINTVTYDDENAWPTSPDGTGPSLELRNPSLDNSLSTSWGASLSSGGTPKAENSLLTAGNLPVVANVNDPNGVTANQAVTITADITDADSVKLAYKTNFDADIEVPMVDDGTNGDNVASDGTYSAIIPGQAINTLVRFKVTATNDDGDASSPGVDDSINYFGYYVKDPSITSAAPIFEWFMEDSVYDDMYANYKETEVEFPCVFVYGDQVFDSSFIRFKGSYSRTFPKMGYKVDLPSGYEVQIAGMSTPLSEFHLNADYTMEDAGVVPALWWMYKQVGLPAPDNTVIQFQRNGHFEGAYLLIDKMKDDWQAANGFDDGAFYQDYWEILGGTDDYTLFDNWRIGLSTPNDPQRRSNVLDQADIPNHLNNMAFMALALDHDHWSNQNTFAYRANSTERWSLVTWDLDLAFQGVSPETQVSPYNYGAGHPDDRFYYSSLYDQKDLRQAYFRRLRTLVDRFYVNNELRDKIDELSDQYADLSAADVAKWPSSEARTRTSKQDLLSTVLDQERVLLAYLRQPGIVPGSQTDAERQSVSISDVHADADDAQEYIKLANSSDEAVDISGWEIAGINYTIPEGSVIPGHGEVFFVRNDIGYKAAHDSVIILGQYGTDLGSSGSLTLKTNANVEIDGYDY